MPKPKCLFFKAKMMEDDEMSAFAEAVPFAKNCIECPKRLSQRLEKMCIKEI